MSDSVRTRAELVEALQGAPPGLDDVQRARIEHAVVERARAAEIGAMRPLGTARWRGFGAGVAVGAVAAAALVWLVVTLPSGGGAASDGVLSQSRGMPPTSAPVVVGRLLDTAGTGPTTVSFEDSRLRFSPNAVAYFSAADAGRKVVELVRGRVDVTYHPRHRGEESRLVSTPVATVLVVGTVFSVEVLDDAVTVDVREGVVRVEPRSGAAPRTLRRGESTTVRTRAEVRSEKHAAASDAEGEPAVPAEAEASSGGTGEDHADRAPPSHRDVQRVFAHAERLQRMGSHAESRALLAPLTEQTRPTSVRVRAFTLIAESHAATGGATRAIEPYERAARLGRGTLEGENALYALARMYEVRLSDAAHARDAYARYLRESPNGTHAALCRDALCRLGDAATCDGR
ncbi:MAG: FecR domain-containing protein [Myxococcales bacterium]|nr:FecR domain-containing protein [Myxococcales bacterium]